MKTRLFFMPSIAFIAFLISSLAAWGKIHDGSPQTDVPKDVSSSDWSSIRAAYEAGRHAVVRENNGVLAARNPGQQWRTEFDGKGFTVTPDHGGWTWGLELAGYGDRTLLSASSPMTNEGGKITCQRDENLTEWFINDTRGLEQGWTFQKRPELADPSTSLRLYLSTRGNLCLQVFSDGSSVSFQQKSGGNTLTYGGLKAWDSDGRNLLVRFEQADGNHLHIAIDDQSARYPITIDPIVQQAYLKASNTDTNDNFGTSVAISGDTVVVGANKEDSNASGVNGDQANNSAPTSGAAYVFTRNGTTWTQQTYLKASNTDSSDNFGYSVAISGDTIVVGALIESSKFGGVNTNQTDNSLFAAGAAYVFVRNGVTWSQQAYLKASYYSMPNGAMRFGRSVAISGDTIVVGANDETSNATGVNGNQTNTSASSSGAAYVFVRSGVTWSQQAYLKASNTGVNDWFGFSVAISGDTVVVGAYLEDSDATGVNGSQGNGSGTTNSGAAYVFTRSGIIWSQQAYLKASNTGADDYFGIPVSISGDTIAVGASNESSNATGINGDQSNNSAAQSGAIYIFQRTGAAWSQQAYIKASNTRQGDFFGLSLAIEGDTLVAGAQGEDSTSIGVNSVPAYINFSDEGAAYLLVRTGSIWSQSAYLKASNTGGSDLFGSSVAISGNRLIVGAYREGSNAVGVDGTQTDNSASGSGAAYVFDLNAVLAAPEIAIRQGGTNFVSGGTRAFQPAIPGGISELTFTLLNTGNADLILNGSPKVAVTGSSDFTVTAQPSSPIDGPAGGTLFSVHFAPTTLGTQSISLSIPSNDADENPFILHLTGTGMTPAELFDYEMADQGLTGANANPNSTPFNDGVNNLIKYAFNLNLSGPDSGILAIGTGTTGLPAIGLTGTGSATTIRVEFLRRIGSGLIYTPKRSSTLEPASFLPMTGTPVVTPIPFTDGQWERVIIEEPVDPAATPRAFVTVEVSLP